jgi:imidazolonepropionase-like amidohydrolase
MLCKRTSWIAPMALSAFLAPAYGWGNKGHRIVAQIAEARLSEQARQEVRRLLFDGKYSLADIASCADAVRDTRPERQRPEDQFCRDLIGPLTQDTGPWHYIDIPVPKADHSIARYCPDGNCVTAKINDFAAQLRTADNDADRRRALLFLVHFVGDIHQPLHCVERACDKGGNSERVSFSFPGKEPAKLNLHRVWDTDLVDLAAQSGDLTGPIDPSKARHWEHATADDMAWEGYRLAKNYAYRGIPLENFCLNPPPQAPVFALNAQYEEAGSKVVREQLLKGGVRLAAYLETALGGERVFRDFTLIDGTGGAPRPHTAMVVEAGRIQWIGPLAKLRAPATAEVIEAAGKYIMPGIINLHGHLGNVIDLKQDASYFTRENVASNLHTYAMYGVTTLLSLGSDQDLIFAMREDQRGGRPHTTRIFTAGRGFTAKNGIGAMAGVTRSPGTVEEVEREVTELAAQHPDFIKLWVDDGLGKRQKMAPEISRAIIESAHRHGIRTAAHIFYLQDAKQLVDDGVDALAHSVRDQPVDDELIASMKRHGTWQQAATLTREVSTYVYARTPEFLDDPFFTQGVSAKTLQALKDPEYQRRFAADPDLPRYEAMLPMAQKNLKRLADAGVPIGFGTDSGPPGRFPGYFEHWELELMVQAGLTPLEAIHAATGSAAKFLRQPDLGTLAQGKWADFLVLTRDPVEDIRNTRSLDSVYVGGDRMGRKP